VIDRIEREGAHLATVWLPGVQYLTGQWLDLEAISEAAHRAGSTVCFDLAHAVGNVEPSCTTPTSTSRSGAPTST
jgi:kynureninase